MQWSKGAWANKATGMAAKKWSENENKVLGQRDERRMFERIIKDKKR